VHVYILIANKQAIYASQQPVCHYSYIADPKYFSRAQRGFFFISWGRFVNFDRDEGAFLEMYKIVF
jgi:hypothetical protein